jgi:tRNA modification GTPase
VAGARWEGVPWDGAPSTIVARATPPGRGGIGVVRVSGPRVRDLLAALGAGSVLAAPPRTAVLARLTGPGGTLLDRGLVTFFPAPASYTGEDVAEFSVHGGPMVVASVVGACLAAGAREAERGEFTRRAWLNGKLDRLQVEAIQDLVEAESPARQRVAVQQVEGGLSRRLETLRSGLVEARALLAHHLDFPDEDEAPTPTSALARQVAGVEAALERLLATVPGGRLLREGAVVVLAGIPNAGKSSLFNALVGEERALVTEHAGTTRDAVDAFVAFEGYPVRLVDTAGLRGDAEAVEQAGIEVARGWMARADLVLFCHPLPGGPPPEEALAWVAGVERGGEAGRVLAVASRADEVGERGGDGEVAALEARLARWPPVAGGGWLPVSVRSALGVAALRQRVVERLFGGGGRGMASSGTSPSRVAPASAAPVGRVPGGAGEEEGHVLVRERHRAGVAAALEEVRAAHGLLREEAPAELADLHLAEAIEALRELVGPVEEEAVLDAVFRDFCIGK